MTILPANRRNRRRKRRGAAAVELSVCLPLFVIVIAGSMETCNLIHLRESMCVASYEAARIAVKDGNDTVTAMAKGQEILEERGFEDIEITFDPANLTAADPGTLVTVKLSAPTHSQTMLPKSLLGEHEFAVETVLVKE